MNDNDLDYFEKHFDVLGKQLADFEIKHSIEIAKIKTKVNILYGLLSGFIVLVAYHLVF